jgi:hypothetical protein
VPPQCRTALADTFGIKGQDITSRFVLLLISLSSAHLDHGRSFRLGRRLAFDRDRAGTLAARAIDAI